jgi:hypothetical protein
LDSRWSVSPFCSEDKSAPLTIILGLVVSESLGGTSDSISVESVKARQEKAWEYTLSTSVYVVRNDREYVNPIFTADREWLRLEARYNYETINTGSAWLGWNFSAGEKLVLEVTPMVGGVFGNLTGVPPGYSLSLTYKQLEFFYPGRIFLRRRKSRGKLLLYLIRTKPGASRVVSARSRARPNQGAGR